jgi:hypothetical protein
VQHAQHVTCHFIEEANIRFDFDESGGAGLSGCFGHAAALTGSSRPTIKCLYESFVQSDGALR